MEKEFEEYWKSYTQRLIDRAPQALKDERANSSKMNTPGDWILGAAPLIVIFLVIQHGFFERELLNYLAGAGAGLVTFVISVYLNPYFTGKRRVVDIDEDIKQHYYRIYQDGGMEALKHL